MVVLCDPDMSLMEAELMNGDILCFQKSLGEEDMLRLGHPTSTHSGRILPTVDLYFKHLSERVDITFRHRPNSAVPANSVPADYTNILTESSISNDVVAVDLPKRNTLDIERDASLDIRENSVEKTLALQGARENHKTGFTFQLSKQSGYGTVAAKVGAKLSVDSAYLRFYTFNLATEGPGQPIRRGGPEGESLASMLGTTALNPNPSVPAKGILYYEILTVSLAELERRRCFVVQWSGGGMEGTEIMVDVPSAACTADLLKEVSRVVTPVPTGAKSLRLLVISGGSIKYIVDPAASVGSISTQHGVMLRAEEVPDDQNVQQLQLTGNVVVQVKHFYKTPSQTHGWPFYFVIRRGEMLTDTKKRLITELNVRPIEFSKWRVAVVVGGRAHYVENDRQVLHELALVAEHGVWIGLDHVPGGARLPATERSVVIYN